MLFLRTPIYQTVIGCSHLLVHASVLIHSFCHNRKRGTLAKSVKESLECITRVKFIFETSENLFSVSKKQDKPQRGTHLTALSWNGRSICESCKR